MTDRAVHTKHGAKNWFATVLLPGADFQQCDIQIPGNIAMLCIGVIKITEGLTINKVIPVILAVKYNLRQKLKA